MSQSSALRVAIVRCPDYQRPHVQEAVSEALRLLGGLAPLVRPGQKVLLKPNLLRPSRPEKGIVTHPEIVRAVAQQVAEAGGQITIADSPSGPLNERSLREAYQQAGLDIVAAETGATLNFDTRWRQVPHPQGQLMKRLDILEVALSAEVIISLPRMKTHNLTKLTGAVKNLFGLVPGVTKFGYHAKLPKIENFAAMLLDLAVFLQPALTVMDAVVAMEGDGPGAGKLRPVGLILASRDPVALDTVFAHLVGLAPAELPVLRVAQERELPGARMENIEVVGESIEEVLLPHFILPTAAGLSSRVPSFLRQFLSEHLVVQPVIAPARCTGCATCYTSCPVKAISLVDHKALIDKKQCLRCYCCHEVCPETAVDLKQSWLARLASRVRH